MKNTSIAAAQTIPVKGDVDKNLASHEKMVIIAAEKGAGLIVFPELSLTGYELELAPELGFTIYDKRLRPLIGLSKKFNMIIVAGAPLRMEKHLYIGALIISPDNTVSVYAKHHVHSTEKKVFQSGWFDPKVYLGKEKASLSICADLSHQEHPANASIAGSTVYLASVFVTPDGYRKDASLLENYARKYHMTVLMSNFGGDSGGLPAAGKSAAWSDKGDKIAGLEGTGEGLVIARRENGIWKGEISEIRL